MCRRRPPLPRQWPRHYCSHHRVKSRKHNTARVGPRAGRCFSCDGRKRQGVTGMISYILLHHVLMCSFVIRVRYSTIRI